MAGSVPRFLRQLLGNLLAYPGSAKSSPGTARSRGKQILSLETVVADGALSYALDEDWPTRVQPADVAAALNGVPVVNGEKWSIMAGVLSGFRALGQRFSLPCCRSGLIPPVRMA